MWRFNKKKHLKTIHYLLHHINICILVEKRCIKCIDNIIYCEHSLHSKIALYVLYNGEHILYFMYKNKMSNKDWFSPFCNINTYIDTYAINNCIRSLKTGLAIKELCMAQYGGKNLDYSDCLTLIIC